ncbi:MAG: hypothetical protein QME59_06520, partial [Candidatus Hydrothermarchaeota archaeon]|nr:hypothetical protein [Candidatus Hydrothermarchaeota archaeon]
LIKYAGTKHFRYFISFILPLFIFYFFVPTVTAILGIVKEAREKKLAVIKNPYLQLLALVVLLNSIWPEQDIRYLFPALISILYFSFKFFSSIEKEKLVAVILLISLSLQAVLTINIASGICPGFVLLEDAGLWLRSNTPEDAKLMAGSFYQIHYFSQRKTYQIPGNLSRAVELLGRENISYVVVDTYEKTTPPFAYELNYTLAKRFKNSYGEVWIYKLP